MVTFCARTKYLCDRKGIMNVIIRHEMTALAEYLAVHPDDAPVRALRHIREERLPAGVCAGCLQRCEPDERYCSTHCVEEMLDDLSLEDLITREVKKIRTTHYTLVAQATLVVKSQSGELNYEGVAIPPDQIAHLIRCVGDEISWREL
jgi:predicted nucleic acid-binding Zn ribbon protein